MDEGQKGLGLKVGRAEGDRPVEKWKRSVIEILRIKQSRSDIKYRNRGKTVIQINN